MANKPASAIPPAAHEETYDEWFLRKVDHALARAKDPNTEWVPHDVVLQDWEEQRKDILAMIKSK